MLQVVAYNCTISSLFPYFFVKTESVNQAAIQISFMPLCTHPWDDNQPYYRDAVSPLKSLQSRLSCEGEHQLQTVRAI